MEVQYPAVSFYFQVKLDNEPLSFKEVSGISTEITTEEISEGGENRFKYKVPTGIKYPNLELKRGYIKRNSKFLKWINETVQQEFSKPIETKNLLISLLDEKNNALLSWNFVGVWPVGWKGSDLNAMNNEVFMESITLSYNYFSSKT